MKQNVRGSWNLVIGLLSCGLALSARADDRRFTYTYEPEVPLKAAWNSNNGSHCGRSGRVEAKCSKAISICGNFAKNWITA